MPSYILNFKWDFQKNGGLITKQTFETGSTWMLILLPLSLLFFLSEEDKWIHCDLKRNADTPSTGIKAHCFPEWSSFLILTPCTLVGTILFSSPTCHLRTHQKDKEIRKSTKDFYQSTIKKNCASSYKSRHNLPQYSVLSLRYSFHPPPCSKCITLSLRHERSSFIWCFHKEDTCSPNGPS